MSLPPQIQVCLIDYTVISQNNQGEALYIIIAFAIDKKERTFGRQKFVLSWRRRRDLFAFLPMAKIIVRLGQALAGNSPPDCCI
jgi:hypothetical protein